MKDLTSGNETRLILRFATPMLLGNLFQQLYNVVDSVVVGKFIGTEALAAVGSSFPIVFSLISLIIGVASGGTIVIAQYFGARNFERVKASIGTLYIFLFWASVSVTVIGITFSGMIFRLIQLPSEIIPSAKTYLNIYFLGMIGFFGFNATSAILRGLGDSKTPLYFLILSTLFNIAFDLLFVIVFKWGIAGVAIATVISQGGAFISAVFYLNRTHEVIKISWRAFEFDRDIFNKTLRIGLPTGLQHTFVSLGMAVVQVIVNLFGTNVIAAYAAASRLDSLATLPAMNFGMALSTFVGQNIGAGKTERIKSGLKSTLIMSSAVSLAGTFIMIFFGRYLIQLFVRYTESEVIRIGSEYLVIVGSFYVVFSAMFSINGVMRGAGDTIVPMLITFLSLWMVRIPVAYFLSSGIGESGIWWAIPIGWITGTILAFLYYRTGKWKAKAVVRPSFDL
jgi:putative MATE family efflux protein